MVGKKYKISVITVSYNAASTIEETILSVVNQRYDNTEYIIIDGKSTDGTCDIISKYKDRISCFVSEPDKGIYDAMNKGLQKATGDFVIFLGADDHLMSYDVLSIVASKIQDDNSVYYGNVLRNHRNDLYCGKYYRYKIAVKNLCHQAIFYPRAVYTQYAYELQYKIFADYAYNLKLYDKVAFRYIPVTVSYFNDQGCSSQVIDSKFEADRKSIIVSHVGYLPYIYSNIYHCLRNLIKRK